MSGVPLSEGCEQTGEVSGSQGAQQPRSPKDSGRWQPPPNASQSRWSELLPSHLYRGSALGLARSFSGLAPRAPQPRHPHRKHPPGQSGRGRAPPPRGTPCPTSIPAGTKPCLRPPTCVPLVVADEPPGEEPHHERCGQAQTGTISRAPPLPAPDPTGPGRCPPHLSCPRRCPPPRRS